MSSTIAYTSLLVVVVGIALSAAVLASTREPQAALPVLLDFMLAAGLLRLSATATWEAIASAAGIVVIRKIVVAGIGAGRRARAEAAGP